ncbi:MAG: multiheme c-type cytochrome [Planctomycetia bacterium]|nr:multiheme c-type cytochrome [Planctomycetia bacterium]
MNNFISKRVFMLLTGMLGIAVVVFVWSLMPVPAPNVVSTSQSEAEVPPLVSPIQQKTPFIVDSAVRPVVSLSEVTSGVAPTSSRPAEEYRPSRRGIDPNKPFDPIAENGAIFEGWEKPVVTLILTGRLNGYLEPCGCAGMERMMGGLSRRATFFQELEEKGWNPVFLDTGGISPGFTQQAKIKFLFAVNMLREMGYDAITLGNIDLTFPAGDLLSEVTNPGRSGHLFVSSNVGLFEMNAEILPPAKVLIRNGIRIGILGILGDVEREEVRNDEIRFAPADASLKRIVPLLKSKSDFVVLLAYASIEECRKYAREYPDVDVIVSVMGTPVPPSHIEILEETGQYLATVGEKGMHCIALGIYDDDENPVRYERVPMDSRFAFSQKILDLMALYQDQLKRTGLEGLGIRPLKNPAQETHGTYVGSDRCESCHEESYQIWRKSRHFKAWKSLKDSTPTRTADPECIVCHVVGWNIEHATPYQSGFLDMEKTPHLSKVGCESCHGPGSKHIEAEMGTDAALQEKLRQAVRVTMEDAKKTLCITCHDLDNSPYFDFDLYWPCIEHKEEEETE